MSERTIGLIGAGNMSEALLGGWLRAGLCQPSGVRVSDVQPERLQALAKTYGVAVHDDNRELAAKSEVVVLAVKPQVAPTVLAELSGGPTADPLVVSIVAGLPIEEIEAHGPAGIRVIRTMPNTPALIGAGATGIAAGSNATASDVAFVEELFSAVGVAVVVPEAQLDAVTGLSGSGPAYVMLFIESLADGGVRAGLARDVALRLATQTVLGSARLVEHTKEHPGVLKDRVTSPAGTTIAGIAALERGAFRSSVMSAVTDAAARATELGRRK